MNHAPVLIATLNRERHFKNCIASLAKCKGAVETPLYIALDYPPSEKYIKGYEAIKEFIPRITGFKKIEVIKRKINYGSKRNFFTARDYLYKKYDAIISSEDDNEFSVDFLEFMNHSLTIHKSSPHILAVCGYMYPIRGLNIESQQFLYNGFSAWGWGTWRDKYNLLNFDGNESCNDFEDRTKVHVSEISDFLEDRSNIRMIKNHTLRNHLRRCVLDNKVTSDSYVCFYQIKNKMYSIFPRETLVRNLGNDGSGEHCSDDEGMHKIYSSQRYLDSFSKDLMSREILVDSKTISKVDRYLSNYTFRRAYQYLLRLLMQKSVLFTKLTGRR